MFAQITITPTSTTLHHAAAWLQATFELTTPVAWLLTGAATYGLAVGAVVATVAWLESPYRG